MSPAPDTAWRLEANCRGIDTELFFTERGESTAAAKAVCRTCPAQAPCLEYALAAGEKFGIYGGKSESERRRLRRLRKPEHWNRNRDCIHCQWPFFAMHQAQRYCSPRCRNAAFEAKERTA